MFNRRKWLRGIALQILRPMVLDRDHWVKKKSMDIFLLVVSTPLKNITVYVVYVKAQRQRTTPAPNLKNMKVSWDYEIPNIYIFLKKNHFPNHQPVLNIV